MENECQGCKTYERDKVFLASSYKKKITHCALGINPHISETKECPCINCLVKGMCIEACPDLIYYASVAANTKVRREAWRKRTDGK